jgi:hypothetical protein
MWSRCPLSELRDVVAFKRFDKSSLIRTLGWAFSMISVRMRLFAVTRTGRRRGGAAKFASSGHFLHGTRLLIVKSLIGESSRLTLMLIERWTRNLSGLVAA